MVTVWQIVKSAKTQKYLLFLDGTKKDLEFIYGKISPFVESARYAKKPYNYCFFLKNIDSFSIEKVKKAMSLFTEISKKTDASKDFQPKQEDDFFSKLQKGILNLAKLKIAKYTGENQSENPTDIGIEIETPASWHVVDDKKTPSDVKTDAFFDELQNKLIKLGKEKIEKYLPSEKEDLQKLPDEQEKSTMDFEFLEEFLGEKSKVTDEDTDKHKIEEETQKIPVEVKDTADTTPAKKIKSDKKAISVKYPKRFDFEKTKADELSPFAPSNFLQTFENLNINSAMRGAHATILSVTQHPGEYDIPFTISGPAKSAKTHILNAIYAEFRKQFNNDKILFTTGIKLSKFTSLPKDKMIALGRKPDEFEAMLVDNIEHMLINSTNKQVLKYLFEHFQKNKKQIIFTSIYDRENLKKMFSRKGFDLPVLENVLLKAPTKQDFETLLDKHMENFGFSDEDRNYLIGKNEIGFKNIERLSVLKNLMEDFPKEPSEILGLLQKSQGNVYTLTQSELGKVALFRLPDENIWGRWGVFYHKGTESYIKYVLSQILENAKKLKIQGGWENVFLQSYENPLLEFFPAEMANYAFGEKVNSAIVIGPPKEHPFFEKTSDFFSMLDNAFSDIGINAGCINHNDITNPTAYTKLIADALR